MPINFEINVFINCPFDKEYSPILDAITFCVKYAGLNPRLATERLDAGESRLDKIIELIQSSKYSIHDLCKCRASIDGEYQRMNMPFELGVDLGLRRSADPRMQEKQFLIFENQPYDLKRALSDISGQDVEFHKMKFDSALIKTRDFFASEAGIDLQGDSHFETAYVAFQGWQWLRRTHNGHSERGIKNLSTTEKINDIDLWIDLGKPNTFTP